MWGSRKRGELCYKRLWVLIGEKTGYKWSISFKNWRIMVHLVQHSVSCICQAYVLKNPKWVTETKACPYSCPHTLVFRGLWQAPTWKTSLFTRVISNLEQGQFHRSQCRVKFKLKKSSFHAAFEEWGGIPPRRVWVCLLCLLCQLWEQGGSPDWSKRKPGSECIPR